MRYVLMIFVILLLVLGLGSGQPANELRNFIAIVFAAFSGSYASYTLSVMREEKKEKAEKARKINSALFAIWDSKKSMESFYKESLLPYKNEKFRHLLIHSYVGVDRICIDYDFMELGFLLKYDADGVIYKSKALSDDLKSISFLVNKRSEEFFYDIQKKISLLNEVAGKELSFEELSDGLGEASLSIKGTTDYIYNSFESHMKVIDRVFDELYNLSLEEIDRSWIHNPKNKME